VQQEQIQSAQSRLPELDGALAEVSQAESGCQAANVDENDYTVFTYQDLEFELGLVVQSITKKIKFIENQVGYMFKAVFLLLMDPQDRIP
jgi:hypothetical protein